MTAAIMAGNLPAEVTSFVGRQRDVTEVERLLTRARLVAVTGFGGMGKTRVALRVAARRRRELRHGAWWIDLAGISDPTLLAHTVASTLRIGDHSARAATDILADFLRDRELLLVLDGCEDLSDACADLAEALLRQAPGVTILYTSRRPLGVAGEQVWQLAPLSIPDPGEPLSPATLEQFPALELFAERAAAVRPGFTVTAHELPEFARLCHRLEGVPLSIEMATLWLRTLGLTEVTAQLDDRFGFQAPGRGAGPPRHRTLHAATRWSYELCSLPERVLWARASVFAGSLDLEAAETVCIGGDLSEEMVVTALSGLVDKSILLCEERDGQTRYSMRKPLREYGLARLRDSGEEQQLRRRHRDHYAELARQCDANWFGPDQLEWSARLHAEHDNLRVAFAHCLTRPDEAPTATIMATDLWFYWMACGQLREGRLWLARALAQDGRPGPERARALATCGYLAVEQADLAAGEALLEGGRDLAREVRDGSGYARATLGLAGSAFQLGRVPEGRGLCEVALAAFDALPDPDSMAPLAILNWGLFHTMGPAPRRGGELCAALRRSSEASGELWILTWAHFGLAHAAWLSGRPEDAIEHARQCLRGKWRFADAWGIAVTVELLAWITAAAGGYERAGVLLGASRQTFTHFGLSGFESALFASAHETCAEQTRDALGADGFEAAVRRGSEFDIDQAIGYALTEEHAVTAAGVPTVTAGRDLQVAGLAAEKLSNRQLASRLLIAEQERDLADLMRREAIEMAAIADPDKVMDRLASTLMRVLPADVALLVRTGTTGLTTTVVGTSIADDTSIMAGAASQAGTSTVDATSLADLTGSADCAWGSVDTLPEPLARLLPGARCWLAAPLTSRTHGPALLVVASHTRAGYDEAEMKVSAALAAQGMLAYDSAVLSARVAPAPAPVRPMGVAMVDIDRLRNVNEGYGHAVGDEVIRVVASRIQEHLRSADIVGRYGGGEFTIVLPEVGVGVTLITERLREAIAAAPVNTPAGPIDVTVSIGTAVQDSPDDSVDELVDRAGHALHRAKEGGRNLVTHG